MASVTCLGVLLSGCYQSPASDSINNYLDLIDARSLGDVVYSEENSLQMVGVANISMAFREDVYESILADTVKAGYVCKEELPGLLDKGRASKCEYLSITVFIYDRDAVNFVFESDKKLIGFSEQPNVENSLDVGTILSTR